MNSQFATPLEHVLWLAKNNLPAPQNLAFEKEYSEVFVEMPLIFMRKYETWLKENNFCEEII